MQPVGHLAVELQELLVRVEFQVRREVERRALAMLADEVELAALNFGDLLRNVQTEAYVLAAGQFEAVLVELAGQLAYHFEDGLLIGLLDPDARVLDYEQELLLDLVVIGVDHDFSSEAGVLDGVLDQVDHHLLDAPGVADHSLGEDAQILVVAFEELREHLVAAVFPVEMGEVLDHVFVADLVSPLFLLDELLAEVEVELQLHLFALGLEEHHVLDVGHRVLQIEGLVLEFELPLVEELPVLHVLKSKDDELTLDLGHVELLPDVVVLVAAEVFEDLEVLAGGDLVDGLDHHVHGRLNRLDKRIIDQRF